MMGLVETRRSQTGYPASKPGAAIKETALHSVQWMIVAPTLTTAVFVAALLYVVHKCQNSRHGGRYSYSALEDDCAERLEMDRKMATGVSRESASLAARAYCRQQPRYAIIEQLGEIGSRIDKNWFFIKDEKVKADRLMTLQSHNANSPLTFQEDTKEALMELFQAIQHPYIYPVLDLDFISVSTQTFITTILPYNSKGTLKDLIYRSNWKDDWTRKYQQRVAGLPVKQVQRLGRQILEALLYLQDRGFPPCGHIHSGNIVLQNGVARLSGLENTLLGLTSRIYPTIKRRLRENRDAIDSVCFGHVLFEMCAGYELASAHPSGKQLEDISGYPKAISVLEYIFNCGEQYPSVEDILCCDFFRKLDLREMRAMPLPPQFQLPYSAPARTILKEVRKLQKQKRPKQRLDNRSVTVHVEGGSTPTTSEASTSLGAVDEQGNKTIHELSPTSVASDAASTQEHPHYSSAFQRDVVSPTNAAEVFHTPPHSPPSLPRLAPVNSSYTTQHHQQRRSASSYGVSSPATVNGASPFNRNGTTTPSTNLNVGINSSLYANGTVLNPKLLMPGGNLNANLAARGNVNLHQSHFRNTHDQNKNELVNKNESLAGKRSKTWT